jgi:hypothetical protein
MFRASSVHLQEALHWRFICMLRAVVDIGRLRVMQRLASPQPATCQHLQLHATYTKTASVVPPEDGRLTPETCRGFKTQ